MTEREYHRTPDLPHTADRSEIQQETVINEVGDPMVGATRSVVQEHIAGTDGHHVVRSEHISLPNEASRQTATIARIKQVIYFIFGAINTLLIIRFVFLLLAANPASAFVRFVYALSQPFVAPFLGIFGEPVFDGSVIEWASLVAIAIYMLLAYGIARVITLAYAPAHPAEG